MRVLPPRVSVRIVGVDAANGLIKQICKRVRMLTGGYLNTAVISARVAGRAITPLRVMLWLVCVLGGDLTIEEFEVDKELPVV